ncbi:uncharacterized protein LOC133923029 [Phragmites australis]|uniref:uncharacterized protein LOC133923029 n=1 Tax=Phragmites australis TaxID=29695 RepID=UPI002D78ED35|nr:uncharacterized protein LOC133923029 [Phragmites australis]
MGEPLVDFSAEGVSSSLCFCYSTCENPGCEHSCACCKDGDFEAEIAYGQDDLVVEEIGTALSEVTHVYDDDGPDLGENYDEDDDPLLCLESDSTDDLVDDDTEVVISPAFPSGDASESSIGKSDDGNSTNGTPKLVSAIKGTRAKQGIVTKLSVSWAPDVYDPPVTSDSHTVREHHSSSRKGHYKYKPSKSNSSSRSTTGSKKDKKHSRHSSSSSNNKKDRKHAYRSSSSGISSRTDSSVPQYLKAYSASRGGGSRTDTGCLESAKVSPLVPADSAALPEVVPMLKTMEEIKCGTSCSKEKPFTLLSRQFSPARYKGMFSFWNQNQLAS